MIDKPLFKVKEGRTTITVSHQGRKIKFVAPHFGLGFYENVGTQIDAAGLLRPTFAETVSLVCSADHTRNNKYAQQVLDILNNKLFWGFSDIEYKPEEGAFISDRNRKEVRVPFGFQTGINSSEEFVENPFVLALTEGREGAENLVDLAKTLGRPLVVNSFDSVPDPKFYMATSLYARKGEYNLGLHVSGFLMRGRNYGCAFGLLKD